MDICCSVDLEWNASDNTGTIATSTGNLPYYGWDTGMANSSPETLLLAAIASGYSIMLADLLRAASLPHTWVSVHADGIISSDHGRARFTRVLVKPTIGGADVPQVDAYKRVANAARDECVIGRSVRGNVALVVGEVSLQEPEE